MAQRLTLSPVLRLDPPDLLAPQASALDTGTASPFSPWKMCASLWVFHFQLTSLFDGECLKVGPGFVLPNLCSSLCLFASSNRKKRVLAAA